MSPAKQNRFLKSLTHIHGDWFALCERQVRTFSRLVRSLNGLGCIARTTAKQRRVRSSIPSCATIQFLRTGRFPGLSVFSRHSRGLGGRIAEFSVSRLFCGRHTAPMAGFVSGRLKVFPGRRLATQLETGSTGAGDRLFRPSARALGAGPTRAEADLSSARACRSRGRDGAARKVGGHSARAGSR